MTCKDCVHYEVCSKKPTSRLEMYENNYECKHFKDKSLIKELPCKMGDTVYSIFYFRDQAEIIQGTVINICFYDKYSIRIGVSWEDDSMYCAIKTTEMGKTVFLTKEAAEKSLKEFEENENNK